MDLILMNFNESIRTELLRVGHTRTFGANALVFNEGEIADFLPIVVSGGVKMVRFPEPGKEVIIGCFGAGEIFAIPPALDGKRFPATAVAMEDSRLLLIPRKDFIALKDRSPEFAALIMEKMCGLLRERAETVQILATASAEQRVAGTILRLAADLPETGIRRIKHRRQDIAEMSGLTTESTIRAIRKLADKGLLEIVRGKIHIENSQRLRDFVR